MQDKGAQQTTHWISKSNSEKSIEHWLLLFIKRHNSFKVGQAKWNYTVFKTTHDIIQVPDFGEIFFYWYAVLEILEL